MDAHGLRSHLNFAITAPDGKMLWSFTGQRQAGARRNE
jgi:hypothetical protein